MTNYKLKHKLLCPIPSTGVPPKDKFSVDPILIPGARVKRRSDGALGTVELDPDGKYAVRIGLVRRHCPRLTGSELQAEYSLADLETEFKGHAKYDGCDHDLKVYDSGWTKEEYCTKCTHKRKL